MVVHACNPSYLRGWGRRIAWTWEVEVAVSQHAAIAFQPGEQEWNSASKQTNYKQTNCKYLLSDLLQKNLPIPTLESSSHSVVEISLPLPIFFCHHLIFFQLNLFYFCSFISHLPPSFYPSLCLSPFLLSYQIEFSCSIWIGQRNGGNAKEYNFSLKHW